MNKQLMYQRLMIWICLLFLLFSAIPAMQASAGDGSLIPISSNHEQPPHQLEGETHSEFTYHVKAGLNAQSLPFPQKWAIVVVLTLFALLKVLTSNINHHSVYVPQLMKHALLRPLKFTSNYTS
ncbi:hypothetical protein XYCOK13_25130 [Xylanibacillus composti]|uniref:Uncharacterized protein n=1 Tax=Xylanibacillus composti TaxID=1572762 RepID=A0A8J4H2I0_9BACL|nr:hypothetical protein [Xylanibacillus composti]GIQ69689.1 hypothetical protein XYCOK13_25130 [Xylanibacillus composti]